MGILDIFYRGRSTRDLSDAFPAQGGFTGSILGGLIGALRSGKGTGETPPVSADWQLNGVYTAALALIIRKFVQGLPLALQQMQDEQYKPIDAGAIRAILNDRLGTLWSGTASDIKSIGNSYWWLSRGGADQIVGVTRIPPTAYRIASDLADDLRLQVRMVLEGSHTPTWEYVNMEDVVHLRGDLVDPSDARLGLAPLTPLTRELLTDGEAQESVLVVSKNRGLPGVIFMPAQGEPRFTDAQGKKLRETFQEDFTATGRGRSMVSGQRIDATMTDFSTKDYDLNSQRGMAQTEICGVLGVPPILVPTLEGLARSTYSNYEIARLAFLENTILPMQSDLAMQIGNALLPQMGMDPETHRLAFDMSQEPALQAQRATMYETWRKDYQAGIITRAEYRAVRGMASSPEDEQYREPAFDTWRRDYQANLITRAEYRTFKGMASSPEDEQYQEDMQAFASSKQPALRPVNASSARETADKVVRALQRRQPPLRAEAAEMFEGAFARIQDAVREAIDANPLTDNVLNQSPQDDRWVLSILASLRLSPDDTMRFEFEAFATSVLWDTTDTIDSVLQYGFNIPDHIQRQVVATGGKRVGLLDLTTKMKETLFDTLATGRAEGKAGQELADTILDKIGAGKFKSVQQRALTIARTETRFAQVESSIAAYESADVVTACIIYDDQIGYSDENPKHTECKDRAGTIVSFEEAKKLSQDEHPNGTLMYGPFVEEEA